jgi:hypothetical protein
LEVVEGVQAAFPFGCGSFGVLVADTVG